FALASEREPINRTGTIRCRLRRRWRGCRRSPGRRINSASKGRLPGWGRLEGGSPHGPWLADPALPALETAAAEDPQDAAAWEAKAAALFLVGKADAALDACAASLRIHPRREPTLFLATNLANQRQRPAEVRTYAERALQVNPWLWQCRH